MLEIDISPSQQRERSDIDSLNVMLGHARWVLELS